MSNLLKTGAQWLADQLQANASETVVYRRSSNAVSITATLGSQLLRTTDRMGNTKVERTDRDFILSAADLILGGDTTEPKAGDYVDVAIGTRTDRYEVMALPGDESPWRYSDPHETLLRVHAKYIGEVSNPETITDEDGNSILIDDDGT